MSAALLHGVHSGGSHTMLMMHKCQAAGGCVIEASCKASDIRMRAGIQELGLTVPEPTIAPFNLWMNVSLQRSPCWCHNAASASSQGLLHEHQSRRSHGMPLHDIKPVTC